MDLYFKQFCGELTKIPEDAMVFNIGDYNNIEDIYGKNTQIYCLEADIINKIAMNENSYFDFSKNIIDVGAGLGEYSYLLPFKHSYAFEANKEMIARLYTNAFLKDRVYDIDIFNTFVSDTNAMIGYNGWRGDLSGCNSDEILYKYNGPSQVHTTTLDSYFLTNIGFIKVDVEGFEEEVLRGAIGTIVRNNYPPILFESWNVGLWGQTQEHRDSLFNFLQSLGYEILEYWGDFETHLAIHKN